MLSTRLEMQIDNLIHGLWLASVWLQGLVSATVLVKRMWRSYPTFTAYSVITFSGNVILYAMRGNAYFYSYAYWLCEVVGLILGFGVVYEVFRVLLRDHVALRRLAARVFAVVFIILIAAALGVAYSQPANERTRLLTAILVTEEATRLLEVGFIGFLFAFLKAFGLHWRQSVFGIALGLGVFVSVELIAVAMRVQFGSSATAVFNLVRVLSFNCSLLLWLGYLAAPEHATKTVDLPQTAQLERWNQAIMELIHQ